MTHKADNFTLLFQHIVTNDAYRVQVFDNYFLFLMATIVKTLQLG